MNDQFPNGTVMFQSVLGEVDYSQRYSEDHALELVQAVVLGLEVEHE